MVEYALVSSRLASMALVTKLLEAFPRGQYLTSKVCKQKKPDRSSFLHFIIILWKPLRPFKYSTLGSLIHLGITAWQLFKAKDPLLLLEVMPFLYSLTDEADFEVDLERDCDFGVVDFESIFLFDRLDEELPCGNLT